MYQTRIIIIIYIYMVYFDFRVNFTRARVCFTIVVNLVTTQRYYYGVYVVVF